MANRFWVGGTATWDASAGTKWATTSGGAGGAAVPTAADDVFLDGSSGAGTVTLSSSSVARSLNCTGFTGTLSHPTAATLNIGDGTAGAGNVAITLVAGMTYTLGSATNSPISFISTSATTQTIAWGGKTPGNVNFNGVGGVWQLQDAWTAPVTTVTLTQGTLDTNGQTCSWSLFNSSGSLTRTLTLGASNITVGATGTPWQCSTGVSMTVNAGTSTIILSGANATFAVGNSPKTYNDVVFTGGGTGLLSLSSVSPGIAFNNVTYTGTASKTDVFQINSTAFLPPINGTLTITGNSSINRVLFQSGTVGSTRTLSPAAVSFTHVDFQDIAASGAAAPWTGTQLGDCGGNSGITFTASATQYWSSNGGNWSDSSKWFLGSGGTGGAGRVPLPQDDVMFDASSVSSGSQTITADMPRLGRSLDFTGTTNNPVFSVSSLAVSVFGSLVFASGMTRTGANVITLAGRSTYIWKNAGVTLPSVTVNAKGGTYTLQDALSMSGNTLTLTFGTLVANNQNVTIGLFTSSNSNARALNLGSGTWTVNAGNGGVPWQLTTSSGMTLTPGTALIDLTDTNSGSKTFAGGGLTYPNVRFQPTGSGGFIITDSNTFASLDIACTTARTATLPAGGTQTITGSLTLQGASGQPLSLVSSTPGTTTALTIAGTTSASFTAFQDINANTAGSVYAVTSCTNNGNNHNVIFTRPSQSASAGAG